MPDIKKHQKVSTMREEMTCEVKLKKHQVGLIATAVDIPYGDETLTVFLFYDGIKVGDTVHVVIEINEDGIVGIDITASEKNIVGHMMIFRRPCRLGSGYCTVEELYNECNSKDSWMCWRDGILIDRGRAR